MLFTGACSSYKNLTPLPASGNDCVLHFKPAFTRSLYNTQVNILHSHLSGLLFIKQMPDSSMRLVFSTETGFKFFDFEFDKAGTFTVHYILDKMNRKMVIKTLETDFGLLLMNRLNASTEILYTDGNEVYHRYNSVDGFDYYITDSLCRHLLRVERTSGKKPSSVLYYQPYTDQLPDSIYINHRGIKFNIALKRLVTVNTGE